MEAGVARLPRPPIKYRVIRREEEPLVTGRDGLNTLKVINSVEEAAATGQLVQVC